MRPRSRTGADRQRNSTAPGIPGFLPAKPLSHVWQRLNTSAVHKEIDMKKLSAILAAVMLVGALAACKSTPPEIPSTQPGTDAAKKK